jgi:hypothetical protein
MVQQNLQKFPDTSGTVGTYIKFIFANIGDVLFFFCTNGPQLPSEEFIEWLQVKTKRNS